MVAEVVIVRVLLPPAVTDAGTNTAVAPDGKPVPARAIVSALPETTEVVTVVVAVDPTVTEPEGGLSAIEKSLAVPERTVKV